MFGFGKAKLFQTHQTLLYQCMHFGEFALGLAQENADEDQIEFWETKLARIIKLRDASLRKNGILDKHGSPQTRQDLYPVDPEALKHRWS